MKNGLIILVFSLVNLTVLSNNLDDQFNQQFSEANHLMEEKLWHRASDIWETLVLQDQLNGNINYKLGYCLLQTANRKLEALPFLKVAVSGGISKAYDPYDPSETQAPIESKYYLARAYHLDYQLDKAVEAYNELLAELHKKHQLADKAKRQIEMCNEAKDQVANPQNFLIENIGEVVNNEFNDYSPVVNADESTLFYTSRRLRTNRSNENITDDDTGEYKEDIYAVYKQADGSWGEPELLNINSDKHAASISVSPDAQTLYIYFDEDGNGNIYKSQLVGESWTSPEPMGSDINSDAWETHITVSADKQSLYFISDREGGYGGRDIYRCVKLPDGSWSKALNLGPTLNTEYEEDGVILSIDGKTLYFTSTGHNSMGDFDIFYSKLGADDKWSEPKNIGYPLNTTDADVFFHPVNGKTAYYSSRREEGYGLKDIYKITMSNSDLESDLTVLKGYIYPAEGTKLPDNCLVVVTNKATGEVQEYSVRKRDGSYISILPPCQAYQIEYFVNEKLVEEEFINVPCESGYNNIKKEVFLEPVHLTDGEPIENDSSMNDTSDNSGNSANMDSGSNSGDNMNSGNDSGAGDNMNSDSGAGSGDNMSNNNGGSDSKDSMTDSSSSTDDSDSSTMEGGMASANYEKYFQYDSDKGSEEQKFNKFIDDIGKMIKANGDVTLFIEASASHVPSSKFPNNQKLAESRAERAKQQVIKAAKSKGINTSKIKFSSPDAQVRGPKYQNDAQKNRTTYELYQYIKISAK